MSLVRVGVSLESQIVHILGQMDFVPVFGVDHWQHEKQFRLFFIIVSVVIEFLNVIEFVINLEIWSSEQILISFLLWRLPCRS